MTTPNNSARLRVLQGDPPDDGNQLPDATLTEERRAHLKWIIRTIAPVRDYHELMYLACGFEVAARQRKNGEEVAL